MGDEDYGDDYNPSDFYEPDEGEFQGLYRIDDYFRAAQADLTALFANNPKNVYFIRQLQVRFEKPYYHWITNNAAVGLLRIGKLKEERVESARGGMSTRFFFHPSNRYTRREIKKAQDIIEAYSNPDVTSSCGNRAENLFCAGLAKKGFIPAGEKVREWDGKKWEKTGHDLDFVFERDGIAYGCEIKNTLAYIEKEELDIKIEMCQFFGIRPLFIMRFSPKTYNKAIIQSGGFAMIFETQIYDLSQRVLVEKMKSELGLPADCPRAIPDGILERFRRWHEAHPM
jgi:hypothetical protein